MLLLTNSPVLTKSNLQGAVMELGCERGAPLLLLLLATAVGQAAHIDAFSASVDRPSQHHAFVPLVAFKCGFRNMFLNESSGQWQADPSGAATCLQGKLEILKYCKRVYPGRRVSNIVEYSHIAQIPHWCDEETGGRCQKSFYIRPYRCLGESSPPFFALTPHIPNISNRGRTVLRGRGEEGKKAIFFALFPSVKRNWAAERRINTSEACEATNARVQGAGPFLLSNQINWCSLYSSYAAEGI